MFANWWILTTWFGLSLQYGIKNKLKANLTRSDVDICISMLGLCDPIPLMQLDMMTRSLTLQLNEVKVHRISVLVF